MDDINYLKKHAEEESFLFVVDSARRDTAVYQQPNEYEVHFHAPFRNVVGLDLIDATVPRTEYLVEARSNTLAYTYAGTRHSATLAPGDYNVLQLVAALNAVLAPRLTAQVTTTPPELSNKIRFVSDAPFTLHTADTTMRKALGLGVASLSVTAPTPGILGPANVVQGPLPSAASASTVVPVRQAVTAPATGSLTALKVYVRSDAAVTLKAAVVTQANTLVAEGTVTTTGTDFEQLSVSFGAAATVQAGTPYFVVLQGTASVFAAGAAVSTAQGSPQDGLWWKYASWTGAGTALCLDLAMQVDGYLIEPPSVVDLTGEPYILIRCPEVESLLYRDRAFESVHAGMGLVKLANYGFREQRFDFTSFPPRKLPTPLGKLSKLTIRLERGDGSLYDTKGVDHHLVLVIKYLELTKGPESMVSTLNPTYNPNPLHYLQTQRNNFSS